MTAALAWLSSDRGLLVVGTSLVLGGLAYVWVDCLRLWALRRSTRDMVDLISTTVFAALIFGTALMLRTWDSLPSAIAGLGTAAVSYAGLRRALRVVSAKPARRAG
jgi:hypothetical protein